MELITNWAGFSNMRKLHASPHLRASSFGALVAPRGITPWRVAALLLLSLAFSPSTHAQQTPLPPVTPDSSKPKSAPPAADALPTGDPKTGVLKPPDIDPKMSKPVPDIDPAMDKPPPGTPPAAPDAPPPTANPR